MKYFSQMLKNIPQKRLKMAVKFVMFGWLCVPVLCPTPVSHLKSSVLGIKKALKIKA